VEERGKTLRNTFRSLRHRNFRLYFEGQGISLIGTWIQRIAVPWFVYHLTGSVFLLGVVDFSGQIPTFLLAPFAGVLADRWNKLRALIVTQLLSMLQALALGVLYFSKNAQIWHFILLNVFLGCVNAFDTPLRQSLLIELVGQKKDIGNAIALNSSMVNMARLLGPSIAGILIAATNEGICFLANAISFVFVVVSLLRMDIPGKNVVEAKRRSIIKDLKDGFSYVFRFPPLRYIVLLLALVSLMGMPYTVLMPIFASKILHGGSHTFGFLMGATGVGASMGAFYLASRRSVIGFVRIIPISAGVFGVGLIAFALSRTFVLSIFMMLVTGLGMILNLASSNTILQTISDDDKRGRVMGFYTMAFMGTAPFGSLLAGTLGSKIGAPNTLILSGASCILGGIIFAAKIKRLRELIRPIYTRLGIIPEVTRGIQSASDLQVPPKE